MAAAGGEHEEAEEAEAGDLQAEEEGEAPLAVVFVEEEEEAVGVLVVVAGEVVEADLVEGVKVAKVRKMVQIMTLQSRVIISNRISNFLGFLDQIFFLQL